MSKHNEVSDWLYKKMREWDNPTGKRKSIYQFAKYLEVPYTALSKWLNKKILPANNNVIRIANKLGPEIYDILGWDRPK